MVLAMMHPTGESGQSQGEDRHETEPLIEPSKKSLWKKAKTHSLAEISMLLLCSLWVQDLLHQSGSKPGTGHLKYFFTTLFTAATTMQSLFNVYLELDSVVAICFIILARKPKAKKKRKNLDGQTTSPKQRGKGC